MRIFESDEELAQHVANEAARLARSCIGVDGIDKAGKSTLADRIARAMSATLISVDDYVEHNMGGYVPYLHVEKLAAIATAENRLVIEGICLLNVADKIRVKLDKLIYVKRLDSRGAWIDKDKCSPSIPVEAVLQKLENRLRTFIELQGTTMQSGPKDLLPERVKEIVVYHAAFKPAERADYVFHRRLLQGAQS